VWVRAGGDVVSRYVASSYISDILCIQLVLVSGIGWL